ncbi:hypothetical protein T439DRAFT_322328 [Meredithblackwellia eburnea MCA 4105]
MLPDPEVPTGLAILAGFLLAISEIAPQFVVNSNSNSDNIPPPHSNPERHNDQAPSSVSSSSALHPNSSSTAPTSPLDTTSNANLCPTCKSRSSSVVTRLTPTTSDRLRAFYDETTTMALHDWDDNDAYEVMENMLSWDGTVNAAFVNSDSWIQQWRVNDAARRSEVELQMVHQGQERGHKRSKVEQEDDSVDEEEEEEEQKDGSLIFDRQLFDRQRERRKVKADQKRKRMQDLAAEIERIKDPRALKKLKISKIMGLMARLTAEIESDTDTSSSHSDSDASVDHDNDVEDQRLAISLSPVCSSRSQSMTKTKSPSAPPSRSLSPSRLPSRSPLSSPDLANEPDRSTRLFKHLLPCHSHTIARNRSRIIDSLGKPVAHNGILHTHGYVKVEGEHGRENEWERHLKQVRPPGVGEVGEDIEWQVKHPSLWWLARPNHDVRVPGGSPSSPVEEIAELEKCRRKRQGKQHSKEHSAEKRVRWAFNLE